jgi:peptidoglycan/LPS O-acetylase OafA/YrhL
MAENRIKVLDSFRGIAASIVVFFHLAQCTNIKFLNFGVTGVDLFFMISGFVIYLTLNKITDWRDFLISRISRLYPIYWIVVSITAVLIYLTTSIDSTTLLIRYVINLTMFQHYFKVEHLDFQYWTLTVEVQFYALMFLIFTKKWLNKIETISIFLLSICLIYDRILDQYFPLVYHFIKNAFPLINHLPLFIAGIVFYRIWMHSFSYQRIFILLLCFVIQLSLFNNGGQSNGFITFNEYLIILIIYFSLFFLFLIQKLKLIENTFLYFLGSISYSMYLFHQFFSVNILMPFLLKITQNEYVSIIIAFSVNILISFVLTYYIEKPLTRLTKGSMKRIFLKK